MHILKIKMKSLISFIALVSFHSCSAGLFDSINIVELNFLNLDIPKDFDITDVNAFKCFDVTKSFDGKPWNPLIDSIDDIFNRFMIEYNKNYTKQELPKRRANVLRSIETIAKCIIDSLIPGNDIQYTLGLTSLADLSSDEFLRLQGTKASPPSRVKFNDRQKRATSSDAVCKPKTFSALPKSLDYRNKNSYNYVTSVKSQLNCGGCWAFATTATIESQYLIKSGKSVTKTNVDLSEQDLINCVQPNGCIGGNIDESLKFVKLNGLASEASVPYTAKESTCKHYPVTGGLKISDYCTKYNATTVPDSMIMRDLNEIGPLVILLHSRDHLWLYKSGVYNPPNCEKTVNHAVTLVGYGSQSATDYWIFKNSWGSRWGESGYFRMKRGQDMCGMNKWYYYPIMTSTAPFNKEN